MNPLNFPFSDLIAGYVTAWNAEAEVFDLRTSDGRDFEVKLGANVYAELVRNLGEAFQDATPHLRSMLAPGRFLHVYGVFYPEEGGVKFEGKHIVFHGRTGEEYLFEKPDWWIKQIDQLGAFYVKAQFGDEPIDYRKYRTKLSLAGVKTAEFRQETDTISRLVYGFATAYMLTGRDVYLEGAEKGTEYLREHMRFYDVDEGIVYWYHGIDVAGDSEEKIFASEFGDDYHAIPAYEQIYALAGPVQTYRITGDPQIYQDAEMTYTLFQKFFKDHENGGYFSHVDPITLDPRSESLGQNRAKKNWNSIGDHAPAYLINLVLATGEKRFEDFLVETAETIEARFQDYANSPFVQEKFFEDWSPDTGWGWQQNRGVIGHNLKIAWNLMRIQSLRANPKYVAFAERIAALMPAAGGDMQRGGWYDVVERLVAPGEKFHRFAWHDRKAWWQQEQGILAYLILAGMLGKPEYLRLARESSAFYNAFFLDHEDGAIYFNVLANGTPYLLGNERFKGSHSMSGYHSFELCYLATVYGNLLIHKKPLTLYFKPKPHGFKDRILRVAPDILPPGSVRIAECFVDDKPHADFDADACAVTLPESDADVRVRVTIAPVA
ncbi:MAG: AGE family epimerase/isomerase [Terrimicrobiaceae bacterium]|nr:AGE family epimerase/isomerase [Terrimicrobiaceae bacterium]